MFISFRIGIILLFWFGVKVLITYSQQYDFGCSCWWCWCDEECSL